MKVGFVTCDSVQAAMRHIQAVIQEAKAQGNDILSTKIETHLNPGDIYDAYLAVNRKPSLEDVLEGDQCGPLAAVFLHRHPDEDPSLWRKYTETTFDLRYADGFRDGFKLTVPEHASSHHELYLLGVYEGVMAHAAVF